MLYSQFSFALADVVVIALMPLSRHSDLIGHRVKFVLGIGYHVRHLHPAEWR